MRKPVTVLLFLFALLVCLATSSDVATQPPLNYYEEGVDSVSIEPDSLIFCPWNHSKYGYCNDGRAVEVSATSEFAKKKGLDFYYLVSGGKIIGEGSKVTWDFSEAKIGKYAITIGVGKNRIIKGKTITKTFTF